MLGREPTFPPTAGSVGTVRRIYARNFETTRYVTDPTVKRATLEACNKTFFVEGQRIFSHVIVGNINFRLKQYLQDLNKNVIHVASPHLLAGKGHFPEIHLNEGATLKNAE